ncbi:hypothetical protein HDU97_006313 [Phlyctochytrium planicorne]|nr:hypothetical protein HDU97_006313 [Phlyctochytrium planicorne]
MEEFSPIMAPDAIAPSVTKIIGQQVLLPRPAAATGLFGPGKDSDALPPAPRKVKLEVLGSNLDLVDMKEGILLERYFVDPVRLHNIVARTKDKMVVEVTIDSGIEKLPGRSNAHGPVVVFKSVHHGAKPIVCRLTSMSTVDTANPSNANSHFLASSTLADGTVFDVALSAFKRAVIHRSHELRATVIGFTAQPDVQQRLSEVKSAFDRLEALCPMPGSTQNSTLPATNVTVAATLPVQESVNAANANATGPGGAVLSATSSTSSLPGASGSNKSGAGSGTATPVNAASYASPRTRSLSDLVETLARIDAFPDANLAFITQGVISPDTISFDPLTGSFRTKETDTAAVVPGAPVVPLTKEQQEAQNLLREREFARLVSQTMDEATARCNNFLRTVCSRIDITLEPSMMFVLGTGVVTGLVTALSIGLLLPEAPVIAAGLGMGFLTSTAVGPLGLGDTVIARAAQREQDNQYRFLLMELVKWVGVSNAENAGLEFLNAYTHENALEDRLRSQGFPITRLDVQDPKRWMCWEEDREELSALRELGEVLRQRKEEGRLAIEAGSLDIDAMKGVESSAPVMDTSHMDVSNPWKAEVSQTTLTPIAKLEAAMAVVKVASEPSSTSTPTSSPKSDPKPLPADIQSQLPPRRNGALLNEDFFGISKPFDRATRGSLNTIAKRIEMVRQIHRIRRLIVEETVVALVGTQDSGKTTGASGSGSPRTAGKVVIRRGMFEHTNGVRTFPNGRLVVADFPGSDSTALSLDQAMRRFGSVASVALLLCHFNGDASGEVLRNLEEIKEWSSRIPILLCIHQAGNKVNSNPDSILYNDELTCSDDVDRFILRWTETIRSRFPTLQVVPAVSNAFQPRTESGNDDEMSDTTTDESAKRLSTMSSATAATAAPAAPVGIPGVTVAMTEFAKELSLCRSFGIWGVREVRAWIRERISEGNFYISMDDLLEALPDQDE